ncbi:MAG: class II aldolase/adducin family protein [Firmicutes bacterium]|nr:class II aldolase/adducin family protein [Bacillota bacterium]
MKEEDGARWQQAREKVVWASREMSIRRLVVGTWGNVSTRVGDCLVVTPSGMDYMKLQADDPPVLDLEGRVLLGGRRPSTETPMHRTIYRHREDVRAIVHTHSPYAAALSAARQPLPPILEELAQMIGGEVRVAEYALPGTQELADRVVAALGDSAAAFLPNHGLVGVGRSVNEALLVCEIVEKGAMVYCYASMLGKPTVLDEEKVKWLRNEFLTHYGQKKTTPGEVPG